jgi:hypothetical protein
MIESQEIIAICASPSLTVPYLFFFQPKPTVLISRHWYRAMEAWTCSSAVLPCVEVGWFSLVVLVLMLYFLLKRPASPAAWMVSVPYPTNVSAQAIGLGICATPVLRDGPVLPATLVWFYLFYERHLKYHYLYDPWWLVQIASIFSLLIFCYFLIRCCL